MTELWRSSQTGLLCAQDQQKNCGISSTKRMACRAHVTVCKNVPWQGAELASGCYSLADAMTLNDSIPLLFGSRICRTAIETCWHVGASVAFDRHQSSFAKQLHKGTAAIAFGCKPMLPENPTSGMRMPHMRSPKQLTCMHSPKTAKAEQYSLQGI